MLFTACDELITETNEITISGYPQANFVVSADSCCRPCSLQFFDNSNGPRHTYIWSFGDGDSATTANPFHYYTDTGLFDITLLIRDTINGNFDNEIKLDHIHILDTIAKIPSLSFFTIVGDTADSLRYTFSDSTRGKILSWLWNFGDATSATGKSVVHSFDSAGTYEIRLTIENFCDSSDLFDTLVVN